VQPKKAQEHGMKKTRLSQRKGGKEIGEVKISLINMKGGAVRGTVGTQKEEARLGERGKSGHL